MVDFNKFFNDEYQFTLKEVTYSWIETNSSSNELQINVFDQINAGINGNQLEVTFARNVNFTPESLYTASVVFSFILTFRSGETAKDAKEIDWNKMLVEQDNPYLGNVISRASHLIATLTSSYGQQPLITPPSYIRQ